jgi:hypothetical protein
MIAVKNETSPPNRRWVLTLRSNSQRKIMLIKAPSATVYHMTWGMPEEIL